MSSMRGAMSIPCTWAPYEAASSETCPLPQPRSRTVLPSSSRPRRTDSSISIRRANVRPRGKRLTTPPSRWKARLYSGARRSKYRFARLLSVLGPLISAGVCSTAQRWPASPARSSSGPGRAATVSRIRRRRRRRADGVPGHVFLAQCAQEGPIIRGPSVGTLRRVRPSIATSPLFSRFSGGARWWRSRGRVVRRGCPSRDFALSGHARRRISGLGAGADPGRERSAVRR